MSEKWIIDDLAAALDQFEAAMQVAPTSDLIKAGCIRYFEFTFELAWKSVKILSEQTGLDPGGSPRSCLKTAFAQGWIDDESLWLEMLETRNRMSHTYHAKEALQVYDRLSHFTRPMRTLLDALRIA
ncbi:MAG: nucleotidyltransferase substrate binding protein [Hydrogenophilales bacterium]|nr:nucleotidyltransferase substrate binding protein [Hydrogenophilales bacterium]